MNIFQEVIGNLNKEEIRNYKIFASRTNAGDDRKDILLFDIAKKMYPGYNDDEVAGKLYESTEDKNSLYRLKNRLMDDIGRSLLLLYYDESEVNFVLNQIILSRLFQKKSQTRIAFHYLGKAEKKASAIESSELLELIYTELIKLSHETLEINPEEYIRKRKENREKLGSIQQIDDILAAVIYRVKISQNFSRKDYKILDLLQKTVNDFSHDEKLQKNPTLRFKIYHALSRILLQQQDYASLEKYLLKTYNEFLKEKLFNKNNHDTKLQMLTYLINSLFKNQKVDLSLHYAGELKEAMNEYGGFLHDKYLFYYYNSLVYNYAVKDLNKAIQILHEAKEDPVIKKLPIYTVFIYLNLAVANFDSGNYKEALKNLVKLLLQDEFRNLDEAFRFKILVSELLIRYELGDTEFLEKRTGQLQKEFRKLMKQKEFARELEIMSILSKMIYETNIKGNKKLSAQIKKFISSTASTDNDVINYTRWLQSKV